MCPKQECRGVEYRGGPKARTTGRGTEERVWLLISEGDRLRLIDISEQVIMLYARSRYASRLPLKRMGAKPVQKGAHPLQNWQQSSGLMVQGHALVTQGA